MLIEQPKLVYKGYPIYIYIKHTKIHMLIIFLKFDYFN